jgi:hypothetical protein
VGLTVADVLSSSNCIGSYLHYLILVDIV